MYKLPESDDSINLIQHKINLARIMCVLSIVLFMSGIILDNVSAPLIADEFLFYRIINSLLLLGCFLSSFKTKFFINNYNILLLILFMASAITIQIMIFKSTKNDLANQTYFAGLMLVNITVFLATYLPVSIATFVGLFTILNYLAFTIVSNNISTELAINNIFFLIASVAVGFIGNTKKDKFVINNITLQNSMKTLVKQQSREISRQTELASLDYATGLLNRRGGKIKLDDMLNDAKTNNLVLTVYFIDLDGFKQINDTYGHKAGDEILIQTAKRLSLIGRQSDLAFRNGGDEFVFVSLGRPDGNSQTIVLNRLKELIKKPIKYDHNTLSVDSSIGYACYPHNANNVDALLDIADSKMYAMKQSYSRSEFQGRNNTSINSNVINFE